LISLEFALKAVLRVAIRTRDSAHHMDRCYAYRILIFLQPLKGDRPLVQKQNHNSRSNNILEIYLYKA
jgi:hypothetical protein